jgi:hypothetical protein
MGLPSWRSSCTSVQMSMTLARSSQWQWHLPAVTIITPHISNSVNGIVAMHTKQNWTIFALITYLINCGVLPEDNICSSNITSCGKLNTLLCHGDHNYIHISKSLHFHSAHNKAKQSMDVTRGLFDSTCITNARKIFTNPWKLGWRHRNNSMVFCLRNS